MKTILTIWMIFCAGAAMAGERLQIKPFDQAAQDPEFLAYRDGLLDAVVRRDIDAILSRTDQNIYLSFGGHAEHEDFRAMMVVDPSRLSAEYVHQAPRMREEFWAELETVLRMGGQFEDEGQTFAAPYTWAIELPRDMDGYTTFFVTGQGVALRKRPIRYGALVARLDHDVVTLIEGGEGTAYRRVRLGNGVEGFVHQDYLRGAVGYRAAFAKIDGTWRLTTYIAGD